MTKEIPLSTSSAVRQSWWIAFIDDEDYEDLAQYNWSYHDGYAERKIQRNYVAESIFIHQVVCPCLPGYEPHHIDGNRLNNQRNNLEAVTRVRHTLLRGIQQNNKSGYMGVSWNPQRSKWQARITVYGVRYHLGCFETPEQANEVLQKFRATVLSEVR